MITWERYRKEIIESLETIRTEINMAETLLTLIGRRMKQLKDEGMYDAVPTESWERRGESGEYMYMIFPKVGGLYTGPGYRRKLYIGCKEDRIAEARRLKRNREEYEDLDETRADLEKWQRMMRLRIAGVAMMAEERPDPEPQLPNVKYQQWALEQAGGLS
jgi:hypothetical protein